MRHYLVGVLLSLLVSAACAQPQSQSQWVRQIPISGLPEAAMASFDSYGPVVYFNPVVMQQLTPGVRRFFFLHETAHHMLGHVQARQMMGDPWNRRWLHPNLERAADCYAAQRLSPQERNAVAQTFARWQGDGPAWLRPVPYARASLIGTLNGC